MEAMRDENQELPENFLSEIYKWALECEFSINFLCFLTFIVTFI